MRYYEVLIGDLQYHGTTALTYSWGESLPKGTVVRIALRQRSTLGIILKEVAEPSYTIKPISAIASSVPLPEQTLQLINWFVAYYPAPFGSIVRQFLPTLSTFPKKPSLKRDPKKSMFNLPPLTPEQTSAIDSMNAAGSYLLHGITGSGKTRTYLELALRELSRGKTVMILTPEIGLTGHIAQAFSALPFRSIILHSRLTAARRRNLWYEILEANEPLIIIGPRSALFTPAHNIGLIVMDEAHDQAYKNDAYPHYRTDRVAAVLAHFHEALFVAGTATPNVDDFFAFNSKKLPIITLNSLANSGKKHVATQIVDMRDTSNFGRSRIFTKPLIGAIERALSEQEQVLLFLNRRGTAGTVICAACGWRAICEHCDLPMTYHADIHSLQCHTCGRRGALPSSCPECGKTDILLKSIGTKAVVEEISRLFPAARTQRFDTDTDKDEHVEQILPALQEGTVDIIVGTQMITKGLDLPKLSVVGVINADSGLLMPDFSAAERTYQLISQVVGRVGRGHRPGSVILQTYSPESQVLTYALSQNYEAFYTHELEERRAYRFPPFCYIARLTCLRATSKSAESTAIALKQNIIQRYPSLVVEGPSPTFHPKESGKYKWQLIVKSPSRQLLTELVKQLPSGWHHNLDPTELL